MKGYAVMAAGMQGMVLHTPRVHAVLYYAGCGVQRKGMQGMREYVIPPSPFRTTVPPYLCI
jgi:hypothetical protein